MANETARIDIDLSNGKKAGETLNELTATAVKLNREIKNLKPGTEEFTNKTKDLQKVNSSLGDIRKQVKGTTDASNELKEAFAKFVPFGGQFLAIGQKITGTASSVGGLSRSFGFLRTAIVSTGIGALVVILGSLIAYLTSTQSGMDKVTAVTRPLQAIFQRLIGVAQVLGEKVFKQLAEAIDNPRQAVIDLANSIKDNLIKRFEALSLYGPAIAKIFSGEFVDGFKDLGNAAIQLTTGIEDGIGKIQKAAVATSNFVKDGIDAGTKLDQIQKQIEKTEISLTTTRSALNEKYQESKEIAQDTLKTDAERITAAKAAQVAQNELLNKEQHFLDLKIEKRKLEHTLNDTSRADDLELAKLEAERIEFAATAAKKRASAKALENTVVQQAAAEEDRINKEALKQKELDAKNELQVKQNLEDLKIEVIQDEQAREIAELELQTQRKIEALIGSEAQIAEQRALLEVATETKIQEIRKQAATKKLADLELEFTTEQNLLNEQLLSKEINEREFLDRSEHYAIEFQNRKLAILKDSFGEQSAEYQKAYADLLIMQTETIAKNDEEFRKSIEIQGKALQGSLGVLGQFFGTLAGFHKQGTKQWKAFATANAIISTIQGAINAYASTSAIPVVGPFLAPIAAGIALAAGYAQVRKIQSTEIPAVAVAKAEKGIVLHGPSHANGGIPIEAEGDEIILTKGVYRNPSLRRIASQINVAGGGRKFEAGGPANPFENSRSPISRESITQISTNENRMDRLEGAFREYANKVDRWARSIKVNNNLQEVAGGLNTLNKLKQDADV